MAELDPRASSSTSLQRLSKPKDHQNSTKKDSSKGNKTSSSLLADVKFERKNKPQPRLPPDHTIQKRPITHAPIAAPYAGPEVQKVVYVSKQTPIMAAVKRVKKYLAQAEKRNLQREGILGTGKRAGNVVAAGKKKSRVQQEVVLVKGSGRAIEQAAKVGEWFKRHAEDGDGGWVVNVRPTSVKVIDDIVQVSSTNMDRVQARHGHSDGSIPGDESQLDPGPSTVIHTHAGSGDREPACQDIPSGEDNQPFQGAEIVPKQKKLAFKKRKRLMYEEDDVPEARTRFVHAIEIAVSLKE